MMELTINDQVFSFNFGIGFLREINKTTSVTSNGISKNIGGAMQLADLMDGDTLALVDVLYLANKGQNPRITRNAIEDYLDDPETDIDAIFDMVLDFLSKSNATKKLYQRVVEEVENEKKNRRQQQNA